jgi:hypothetical protein
MLLEMAQGLAGLLQQREESAVVLQVVVLVRMVVLGNGAAQLALAALQHDSSEAQQLVLAASKRVPLRLRA